MVPSRRALLASAASLVGALLTGCLDRSNGGERPTGSPTEEPSPTDRSPADDPSPTDRSSADDPSPTRTPLPNELVAWPAGPKERPSIPDELTRSSVESFVHTHEYRFVYNTLWMGEGTEVNASCDVLGVRETSVGYEAVVSCTAYASAGGEPIPNSTATTTPIHSDYFTQVYTYLVDENSVIRREATTEEAEW